MRAMIEEILEKLQNGLTENKKKLVDEFIAEMQEDIEFKIQEMWLEYELQRHREEY